MKRLLLFLILASSVHGAIRNAATLDYAEVNACVNGGTCNGAPVPIAPDGTEIVLPSSAYVNQGTWALTVNGNTTAALAFNADKTQVRDAIVATDSANLSGKVVVLGSWDTAFIIQFDLDLHAVTVTSSIVSRLAPISADYLNSCVVDTQQTYAQTIAGVPTRQQVNSVMLGLYWTNAVVVTNNVTIRGQSMFDGASKTKITGYGDHGQFFMLDSNASNSTMTLAKMELNINTHAPVGNAKPTVAMHGITRPHVTTDQNVWVGGFQITEVRWTLIDPFPDYEPTPIGWCGLQDAAIHFGDWVIGKMDHSWLDWPLQTSTVLGAVPIDFSHGTAPGYRYVSGQFINPPGFSPAWGVYSLSTNYVWGGGLERNSVNITTPDATHPVAGLWADYDAVYIENCLLTRGGITDSPGTSAGVPNGGGRIVYRYNSDCGAKLVHGFDESGGQAGCAIFESYNNYSKRRYTYTGGPYSFRSGTWVIFNDRYEAYTQNNIASTGLFKFSLPAGNLVGPSDGTNFFDDNSRNNPLYIRKSTQVYEEGDHSGDTNYYSFTADTPSPAQVADSRLGYVYAHGTGMTKNSGPGGFWTIVGLDSAGATNKWVGFSVRNKTQNDTWGCPESSGAQLENTNPALLTNTVYCALITSSSPSGSDTIVTISGVHNGPGLQFSATDVWELRYVKNTLGGNGTINMPQMNGGSVGVHDGQAGYPAFLTKKTIDGQQRGQYWASTMNKDGIWTWANKYRSSGGGTWTPATVITSAFDRFVWGGIHFDQTIDKTVAHGAPATGAGPGGDYPKFATPTADQLRIGADPAFWGSNGPNNAFSGPINPTGTGGPGATEAWGYGTYPLGSAPGPTPTPGPTGTPTPTPGTPTPTPTPGLTPTPTPTATPIPTPTPTPTPIPTATPTPTPGPTAAPGGNKPRRRGARPF